MHNFLLERLKKQMEKAKVKAIQPVIEIVTISPPVSLILLRQLLNEAIKEELIVKPTIPQELSFANVFEFVEWYEKNQENFSPEQRVALNTLVQTRDMIGVGCNCRRPQREQAAWEYFKIFWENNIKTDIIPTIMKISGASVVKFGNFLIFPI
jgi:hypothetical protein